MRFAKFFAVVISISFFVSVSGCGKSKQEIAALVAQKKAEELKKQDDAMTASFQAQTAQQLKDPQSAQFVKVRLNTTKTALCGQVNAKNGYGGYVGFRDFIATEKGVFIKPEVCGNASMADTPPTEGIACIKYAIATIKDNTCD